MQSPHYKVELVIPAGRKRYMDILIPQLLREEGWNILNIWVNTKNTDDLNYINGLIGLDERIKITLAKELQPTGSGETVGQFYRECIAKDTLYIKFDDDICYVEPGTVQKLATFHANNPQYFLVSPIVINNALFSYLFQILGKITVNKALTANSADPVSWGDPLFAEQLHNLFLNNLSQNNIEHFKFINRPIALNRFSINCISWLGSEFEKFGGVIPKGTDDEQFLSVTMPTTLCKSNCFYGETIVSHFSFFTQREYLDKTNILERYKTFNEK